jgi:tripartite ATP-independent transporter DctM subunit
VSPGLLTASMFGALLLGLVLGFPVAFVLGGLGFLFGIIVWGPQIISLTGHAVFGIFDNYVLAAVPLFILMAQFLTRSKVADGLFESLRYLAGPIPGGIGLAVVAVCTVFAACTGIVGASIVTIGVLSIPVLLRYNYQKDLTMGVLAAGGSLGIIIAPSIMLVIMGVQANLSVGKLFMSALIPGLMLATSYAIYVLVRCRINPKLGPPMPAEERMAISLRQGLIGAVKNLIPPMVLILAVLGSIFLGVATPTEAAGMGAFAALVEVVAYKRFTVRGFFEALYETAKISSMALMMLVGATVFTIVYLGGGGDTVTEGIVNSGLGKWGIFFVMMLIVFILGMFLDWLPIIMITFPVFLPVAESLGLDRLWFVTLIALLMQAGFLTPPFGMACFYLRGIAPVGITMGDIYRGAVYFVPIILLVTLLCTVFPELMLWLPAKMIK